MGTVHILFEEPEYFLNRKEAAHLLSRELMVYRDLSPLVIGIPRGGIVISAELANRLQCDMDLVLCHKLRMPFNPEVAIGAVCENGQHFLHEPIVSDFLEKEKDYQLRQMAARSKTYRNVLPKISWTDRVVILTDDGVAMGYTVEAAIQAVRQEKPRKLILALPVGPNRTVRRLAKLADHTICLSAPEFLGSVSQFYSEFPPVEDEEVIQMLKNQRPRTLNKVPIL